MCVRVYEMAAIVLYLVGESGGLKEAEQGQHPALCLGTAGTGDGFPPRARSCHPVLRDKSYSSLCPQDLAPRPASPRVSGERVLK